MWYPRAHMPGGGKSAGLDTRHEMVGVVLLTLALLFILSLLSYAPRDPILFETSLHDEPPFNLIGRVGMTLSTVVFWFIGGAAYLLPVALGVLGGRCFLAGRLSMTLRSAAGFAFLLIFLSMALALRVSGIPTASSGWTHLGQAGGIIGHLLSELLVGYLAPVGAHIVVFAGLVLSVLIATPVSLVSFGQHAQEIVATLSEWVVDRWRGRRAQDKSRRAKVRPVKIIRTPGSPFSADETIVNAESSHADPMLEGGSRRKKRPAALDDFSEEGPTSIPIASAGFELPSAELLLT